MLLLEKSYENGREKVIVNTFKECKGILKSVDQKHFFRQKS